MAILPLNPKLLMIVTKAWELLKPKAMARYKVLKAERDAYVSGIDDANQEMLRSFEATYERLLEGANTDSDIDRRVAGLERALTVPAFLKSPAVVAWLKGSGVKEALFALATAACLRREPVASLRASLADSYSAATGERAELSDGIVNAAVDGLVGGYRARFEEQSSLVVDAVSTTMEDVREDLTHRLRDVNEQLHAISQSTLADVGRAAEPFVSEELIRQLDRILLSRAFDPSTNLRIRELAERAHEGDLAGASYESKEKVFLWAVRILSNERNTFADAQKYFALVDKHPRTSEMAIVSAILQLNAGRADDALRVLRDIATPDGRGALIFALSLSQGSASAVAWYEGQQPPPAAQDITPMGWVTLATAFSKLGRWESSIAVLERARPLWREFPDLLYIEGMYRTALVVPTEFRDRALDGNLVLGGAPQNEGDDVERWRFAAIEVLKLAETEMARINHLRAEHASQTRLWLALGSANEAVRLPAHAELSRLLVDKYQAVRLYPILRQYAISIEMEPLLSYLEARRNMGGLSDEEWVTRFFLALDTFGTPELAPQLLAFLEGHRVELAAIIDARILTAVRVKALLACDGQAARAREELDANRTAFGVDQAAQLEAQIAQVEGEDIRPRLERIYDEAPTIINLTMLVHHLVQVQDWVALEPRVRELYRLERSLPNARMVAACLSNRPDRSPVAIVQFLQGENDVVARDRELMSELAWCSLECGDWKTARELNDVLLSDEPDSERHIGLDINIAVKSGDWEHFASIFDREWARRSNHSPRTLLLLAQLAHDGHVSTDKAFELVRLAAEKGFADVQVLVAAYNAAMHMGREDELSASWLLYAAQTDTSGIVKRVSTRELVEQVLPSLQRKNETLLDSFRTSSVPIQLVTSFLNMPMARLYCAIPAANERQPDARKRPVLPFFGARAGQPPLSTTAKIGFDITSILLLTTLGLLDKALDAFKAVYVAPDTLQLLLKESRHARFQQPSEVQLANDVIDRLRRSTLRPVSTETTPPRWLVEEVGQQLAQLLEVARVSNGYVIAAFPIFRAGSLNEAVPDLKEYQDYVISCRTYVDHLLRNGNIARVAAEKADERLRRMDAGQKVELTAAASPSTVFCVDDVAIRFLHRAGILEILGQAGFCLLCAPELEDEYKQVIAEAGERDRIVATIDSARSALRRAMEAGTVSLLVERPRSERLRALRDGEAETLPTVMPFLRAGDVIGSLAIDDRYFTRLNEIKDEANKPILTYSTLDIVSCLVRERILTSAEGTYARHRLRAMGATYIDVNPEELDGLLDSCAVGSLGLLQESQELKVFRQALVHACALETGHVRDRQFLDSIYGALVHIVSRSWESTEVVEERARALTKWAFDGLGRPLWAAIAVGHANPRSASVDMVALTVSGLLLKATVWEPHRREQFHELLNEEVLEPASHANIALLDTIVSQLRLQLEALGAATRVGLAESRLRTIAILASLPMRVREEFLVDPVFGDLAKASVEHVVQFGPQRSIRVEDLYEAAVCAVEKGEHEVPPCRLRLQHNILTSELLVDGAWRPFSMPELGGLLNDKSARLEAVRLAVSELGPTFHDGRRILAAVVDHPLEGRDFGQLLRERMRGVRARWARIHERRDAPPELQTLVPPTATYYAALLGPVEQSRDFPDYVSGMLLPYRARLIEDDLTEGLRIACLGFFDPALAPSPLVKHIENEELWDALQRLTDSRDPFSLVGLAEVALARAEDSRFETLAAQCIEQLCADEMTESPAFVAAALFAKLALSEIQTLDNAAMMRPYWKRMAAWMQAGVILQSYGEFRFDLEALESWVEQHLQPAHVAAEVMDLHIEPLVAASWTTGEALWDNAFRLLVNITATAEQLGRVVPHTHKIRELVDRRTTSGFASFHSAGPCQSVKNRGSAELSGSDVAFTREKLTESPLSRVWLGLVMATQVVKVPRGVYEAGLNGLRSVTLQASDDWDDKLAGATEAALVALIEGDTELAVVMRDFLVRVAETADSDERVSTLLRALFIAAGAYRDPEERGAWIDDATRTLALAIPPGAASACAAEMLRACSGFRRWSCGPASWAELFARSCS
ncbi:hypothetical protein [Paraburkholderia phenazinium]|uniref:HTH domain-containing protein n=1 Tax=Paraburkholderia phenazinium TaxID=60549 RepID=UPI00158C4802|nr:hypothetical protein [Paraburkholderia phenazinium]